jgi:hypothetical protein
MTNAATDLDQQRLDEPFIELKRSTRWKWYCESTQSQPNLGVQMILYFDLCGSISVP